jgi:hypothetical protein
MPRERSRSPRRNIGARHAQDSLQVECDIGMIEIARDRMEVCAGYQQCALLSKNKLAHDEGGLVSEGGN